MSLFKRKNKVSKANISPMVSNPHIIEIKNKSSEVQDFVLFGSNMHLNEPNFGNNKNICIKYLSDQISYSSFLTEMLTTKYKIGLLRIQSSNIENMIQTLNYNKYNSNVEMFDVVFTRREIKLAIMRDAYQFQNDILDVRLPKIEMDKYHYLHGKIEGESTIVISFFPIEIDETEYRVERISGYNVAPVIIHTTSKIKRLLEVGETFLNKLKSLFKRKK